MRVQQAEALRVMDPTRLLPNTMETLRALPGTRSTALADVVEIAKWIAFYGGKTATDLVHLTGPTDTRQRQHALEFYEAWAHLSVILDNRLAAAVEENQNIITYDLGQFLADT
jgi:hypothetical protein